MRECVLHKNDVFLQIYHFINSQSKLKNSEQYSRDIYQEKVATKFKKVLWWALWFGDPKNLHNSFFVENYWKERKKTKNKKKSNKDDKYFLTFTILYIKICI